MTTWVLAHEPALRLSVFLGVFAMMALWELLAERRVRTQSMPKRWLANLGISFLDSLVMRLIFPAATVGFAIFVQSKGWGLFHGLDIPAPIVIVLSAFLLDLAVYGQHVLFHAVPFLWNLHLVHHSDQDLDVTSGVRFHPVEILLSALIKFAVVLLVGVPPLAAFLFEVVLNATSMFNHANVKLPTRIDAMLRWLIVTPDMHRIHHSIELDESNRNFGFNLSLWDRLFGTYRPEPRAGQKGMVLGVKGVLQPKPRSIVGLLWLPIQTALSKPEEHASKDPSKAHGDSTTNRDR